TLRFFFEVSRWGGWISCIGWHSATGKPPVVLREEMARLLDAAPLLECGRRRTWLTGRDYVALRIGDVEGTPTPACAAPPSSGRHLQTFTTAEVVSHATKKAARR